MSPIRCRSYTACELTGIRFYKYAAPTALSSCVWLSPAGSEARLYGRQGSPPPRPLRDLHIELKVKQPPSVPCTESVSAEFPYGKSSLQHGCY
jgi:hypothetical protein